MEDERKLLIIDCNSLIHRAYHALPRLTTKKGELINAIYGFLLIFFKALKEFQPDFIAAAFDFPAPTFRHQKFDGYKATRIKAPDELYEQIPKVKEILQNFNIRVFEKKGFEADDIIGTISKTVPKKQALPVLKNIILSGDLDILQLVNPQTKVYTLKKGVTDTILYNEKQVQERYQGLKPEQLLDYKSLRGDPSDNIPGVPGIGEKTAIKLLNMFGSLENLYNEIEHDTEEAKKVKNRTQKILRDYKGQAFFSRELAKIKTDVPIEFSLQDCSVKKYDRGKITKIFKEFEFHSLIGRLPELKSLSSKEDSDKKRSKVD